MDKRRITKVDWNEQFKIRPRRNASLKHEAAKLSIMLNLQEKYKNDLKYIRIYSEYPLGNGKICDIYFENLKTTPAQIICYEVQKDISKKWVEESKEFYDNFEKPYFRTDWLMINENELPDNINKLHKEIRKLIL